ncbi:MAG: rhomboid family intramembrane serine protease [Candidatus Omnitrophica bacterium]|nr:rhomboid family intramembrane serine protease [Candidatus Omnitrophota bacterium]
MIPLRDTIPTYHRPAVTKALIFLNVLAFLGTALISEDALQRFYYFYGVVPKRFLSPQFAQLFPQSAWVTLFTSMFLHGGFFHIVSNMWMLWIFGDNVEDRMGSWRFLLFYLTCGLGAMSLHILTNPGSMVPTIGASGAIAGVLGAYMKMYPHSIVLTFIPIFFIVPIIPIPAVLFLSFWFISQFFNGTLSLLSAAEGGGIAWWAHIGGFPAGMLLAPYFLSEKRIASIRARSVHERRQW